MPIQNRSPRLTLANLAPQQRPTRSQQKLFKHTERSSHGGGLYKGRRKERRPFVPRAPMHLVLRSSRACKDLNLLRAKNATKVKAILQRQARRHRTTILEWVNVGNHLHLKVRAQTRQDFAAFLKSFTAMVARAITRARKGHPVGKFWDALAFSRVLRSKLELHVLDRYLSANVLEASFGREVRKLFLSDRRLTEREAVSLFGFS
jgi:REP element-mobilizing transposase RayT